jgi:hypothetical protein
VSKLFYYNLAIEYMPRKLNGVADALSPRETELLSIHSISAPSFQLFDTLREEALSDPQVIDLQAKVAVGTLQDGWTEKDGLFLFKGKEKLFQKHQCCGHSF